MYEVLTLENKLNLSIKDKTYSTSKEIPDNLELSL